MKKNYSGITLEDRYVVENLLGEGGMGAVYLGRHKMIGKKVAIKFLHAELADSEDIVKRFYREAQAAAAIGHRNIVEVFDVGLSDAGEPYLVMEFLQGESLGDMLSRTGPISCSAACGVLEPTLHALNAAHEKGIIHRDLKPDNIFLAQTQDGEIEVKLIDFGISKFTGVGNASKLTQTGSLLGTPAYMAPEQARGDKSLDARADVYAMGVILYQMLTGGLPFTGEHYNELLINLLTTPPRDPCEVNPEFPMEAHSLLMSTLDKVPDSRPQSANELLSRLKELGSFESRKGSLTLIASSIKNKKVAAGDIGETSKKTGGSKSASSVYSDMMSKGTPGIWGGTDEIPKKKGRGIVIGIAAVFVVVAVTVALVAVLMPDEKAKESTVVPLTNSVDNLPAIKKPVPADTSKEKAADLSAVNIEVVGVPKGAKIFYDGAQVPQNPFPVEKKSVLVKLKVQADGMETFITSIIPDKDQTLKVDLVEKKKDNKKRRSPKKAVKKAPEQKVIIKKVPDKKTEKPKTTKPDNIFKGGNRGTRFGNDFE